MQQSSSITRAHLQRLLLLGLGLSALLLLSAVVVALRTVRQIDRDTQMFADRQQLEKSAIDEIQRRQARLNDRWLRLARRKDSVSRQEVLDQLADSRQEMSSALESADQQADLLRESIHQESHGLLRWTVWLFAACVGLSLLCATWAVRASASLFWRLEQQAGELTQMQYQFLETQENIARRFSHELHDELGQALTAVKANLSRLRGGPDDARILDCLGLVDGAIQNVREMSQLLRPTILDDFGLDAALRSLTESFAQRTGIAVNYESSLKDQRLPEQVETNLFRIAQEALTNVARHAQAESVSVELLLHGDEARLTIHDTGRGFNPLLRRKAGGLGLAGMETRARGCGGTLSIESAESKGTTIRVRCRTSAGAYPERAEQHG